MEVHDLNRMFDRLAPTPEQEKVLLDRLLHEERKGKPMKKLKKLTVVAIAAALMVISCAAAVVTGIDQRILEYFGMAPEQETLISPAAVRVEKAHTYDNGWTVNIRQAISDRYSMAVLIDVTAPEGIKLNREESWLKVDTSRASLEGGGFGGTKYSLEDETLPDNQVSYLYELIYNDEDTNMFGSKWELTPEQFLCVEQDGTSREIPLEGWDCTVSLSNQDPGILYKLNQPITINGDDLTLESVYLSPISFMLRLRNGTTSLWDADKANRIFGDGWQGEIVLHTTTGESICVKDHMGEHYWTGVTNYDPSGDLDSTYGHCQFNWKQIMDPAEITSVTIYGQTYELK